MSPSSSRGCPDSAARVTTEHGSQAGQPPTDPVERPAHYTSHPTGVECLDIVEHYPFNVGAAIKYLWRAGLKDDAIQDLRKAKRMVQREIDRLERQRV